MWSVVSSPCSIEDLAKHFRPFLISETTDTLQWPVRWADTRVLPHFLDALAASDMSDFMSVISCWAATSRDGTPRFWHGQGKLRTRAPQIDKLLLSDAIFARLVDAAEADGVLAALNEIQPSLLRSRRPSECHVLVKRQLALADQFNMQASRARQHFSMLALVLRDDFVSLPETRALLEKVRRGSDYDGEISRLPDSYWERASKDAVKLTI